MCGVSDAGREQRECDMSCHVHQTHRPGRVRRAEVALHAMDAPWPMWETLPRLCIGTKVRQRRLLGSVESPGLDGYGRGEGETT